MALAGRNRGQSCVTLIQSHAFLAFVFGMVGGLAINIARWLLVSIAPERHSILFDGLYWAQFFGLMLLGGIVALARDLSSPANPITPMDAIYVGLSLPALLKTVSGELMDFTQGKVRRSLRK